MARKTGKEIEQIKQELGIHKIWSWSKINTYMTDPFEYLLKYVLKVQEDRNDSIYSVSGGTAHDIVEEFYQGKIDNQGILEKYEDKLFEFNTLGLMYDRSDKDKNEKIASKYEDCMRHFFLNHKKATNKPILEPFILIKVGSQYFQGYIDIVFVEERNGRKKIILTDWKTSSIYKGAKLLKESGQILLYGEGIHQKTNMPYEDIVIRFNFMKYVNITYTQKKGDIKIRQVERNAIGNSLQANVKTWLKHYKYTEDVIEDYLAQMIDTNGIECLPEEIKEKFKIEDCYTEVELNEEIINEHKNNIIKIIMEITKKELEYEKTKDKNIFWQDIDKNSSYYHANLSGYSSKIHEPYKRYLEELDIRDGIKKIKKDDDNDIEDLSWLDEII